MQTHFIILITSQPRDINGSDCYFSWKSALSLPLSLLSNSTKKTNCGKPDFFRQQDFKLLIWWAGLIRGVEYMVLAYNQDGWPKVENSELTLHIPNRYLQESVSNISKLLARQAFGGSEKAIGIVGKLFIVNHPSVD